MQTTLGDVLADSSEEGPAFVEVAIPVPLRRLFTYAVKGELRAHVRAGARVAVPFAGRKVVGIVVRGRDAAPEGVKRILAVADVIEREPVFTPELFAFLERAADYYMHPLGEVLRAAAPGVPRDKVRALRSAGFLEEDEALKGLSAATRRETFVAAAGERPAKLGKAQAAVWGRLESGPASLSELRAITKSARQVVTAFVERGHATEEEREVVADPFFRAEVPRDEPRAPTSAQAEAIGALAAALDAGSGGSFLLEGVTGSGKTEVYLQLIARARAAGKGALLLVPEIALTPQLVNRFRARFGDAIAVLHSGLTDRERADAWRALRAGNVKLAIGARSALFAPVTDLSVVVVDEEHDPSFKQEEGFRYHARDMAMLRAHGAKAVCVLGSATPSVETRYLADEGRVGHLRLPERATSQTLPSVEIVDLARHKSGPSGSSLLSAPLHRALAACLESGGQAILFLNRRGFAPTLRCSACGQVSECPTCSVALTLHHRHGLLKCHYCDYAAAMTDTCAACGAPELLQLGAGTEKIEAHIAEAFPAARIARLDRDTAKTAAHTERILDRLRAREVDILVGTQMVTKGHDMPGVTLVGVVLADQSLAFPDFRASERTFQLLSQVAGRAGRGDAPGRVLFQTYQPAHPAILAAQAHDYEAFYRAELAARRELGYAPFSRMASVRIDAGDENVASQTARALAESVTRHPRVLDGAVRVLGPAPAPMARLRGRYRFRLLLRAADRVALRAVAGAILHRIDAGIAPARASLDIDPVSML